ncbi:MAG TPA: hypothetical protein VJN94_10205 [Candidatus Binataceae bacterium]|nr:hypothetical protein [Candidatus Binataceae bacterium]
MDAPQLAAQLGFSFTDTLTLASRVPRFLGVGDLPIAEETRAFLSGYSRGIYPQSIGVHQANQPRYIEVEAADVSKGSVTGFR